MPGGEGWTGTVRIAGKTRHIKGKDTPKLRKKLKAAHKTWMKGGKFQHPEYSKSKGVKKVAKKGSKKIAAKKTVAKKASKLAGAFKGKKRA